MDLTVSPTELAQFPTLPEFKDYLKLVTKEEALESIKNLAQMESVDWFRIGMVLSSYNLIKGEEEFKNLLQYAEENFKINPRKAYYLISIYDNLMKSNITIDQVGDIGWTKLKEIAHLLTSDNLSYWVDICKSNTTKQVITLLKSTGTININKAKSIQNALDSTDFDNKALSTITPDSIPEVTNNITVNTTITPDLKPVELSSSVVLDTTVISSDNTPDVKYTLSDVITEDCTVTIVNFDNTDLNNVVAGSVVVDNIVVDNIVECSSVEGNSVENIESVDSSCSYSEESVLINNMVNILKVYDLDLIISTISNIFPLLKISVKDNQNADFIN